MNGPSLRGLHSQKSTSLPKISTSTSITSSLGAPSSLGRSSRITDVRLASIDKEINEQKTVIRDLNQIVVVRDRAIADEKRTSKNLIGSNNSLNSRNLKLQREVNLLKVRYDTDCTLVTDLQHQLSEHETERERWENETATLSSLNTRLQKDLEAAREAALHVEGVQKLSDAEDLEGSLHKKIITELKAVNEGLAGTLSSRDQTIATMQGELQKARQDVTRLSLGNAALTTTAEQSAEALYKLKEAHPNIQSKLRSAEYQITEFIRENGTLTTAAHESRRKLQIEELEVGRLRAEALEVQQNAKKTKVDYDSLQEKYTDLQRDHIVADNKAKSYFGTFGRLHTQIIRVSKKNNNLKDQIDKLEEKLDDLPLSCQTRCCTLYGKSQQVDSSSVQVELQDTKKKLKTTKDLLQKSEVAKSSLHDWIVKYRKQITALKKDKQIVQGKRAAAEKRAGKWKKKLNEKPRTRKATAGFTEKKKTIVKVVSGKRKRKGGDEEGDAGLVKRLRKRKTGN